MIIHSKSDTGEKALKEREGALIGLSIRNSYFKDENLHELISWAKVVGTPFLRHFFCDLVPCVN